MAQPKSRRGRSDQGHSRSKWKAKEPTLTTCSNCGAQVRSHHVCVFCGYYKNKPASLKLVHQEFEHKHGKKPGSESEDT